MAIYIFKIYNWFLPWEVLVVANNFAEDLIFYDELEETCTIPYTLFISSINWNNPMIITFYSNLSNLVDF